MVIVGVDPAFRRGGFWACFIDTSDRTVVFRQFRDVLTWDRFLRGSEAPGIAHVFVENSNEQKKTFYTHKTATGALLTPSQARKHRNPIPLNSSELSGVSRNVGANQGVSELSVRAAVDRYGKEYVSSISPEKKGTKYNEMYFRAALKGDNVTALNYSGTQDERDAYKLAHMALAAFKMRRAMRK